MCCVHNIIFLLLFLLLILFITYFYLTIFFLPVKTTILIVTLYWRYTTQLPITHILLHNKAIPLFAVYNVNTRDQVRMINLARHRKLTTNLLCVLCESLLLQSMKHGAIDEFENVQLTWITT